MMLINHLSQMQKKTWCTYAAVGHVIKRSYLYRIMAVRYLLKILRFARKDTKTWGRLD